MKYLLRKCEEANFISNCDGGAIFHNLHSKLFHIRHKPNISLERINGLCYNKNEKGGEAMGKHKPEPMPFNLAIVMLLSQKFNLSHPLFCIPPSNIIV